jgi:glycosyltransferase AglD
VPASFSALVPVYNEAPILEDTVTRMVAELGALGSPFEILIAENGSTDGSVAIADRLAARFDAVTVTHQPIADYGFALRHGIAACRHEFVVIYNLDFWSVSFATQAIAALETCDVVLGSKVMAGSSDHRPLLRRLITRSFNVFLHAVFGFRGTDTHGMKAVRRTPAMPIVSACVTGGWVLDTELVLRAERHGLHIVEVPVEVREVRAPGYGAIVQRVPRVVRALATLWLALRRVPRSAAGRAPLSERASHAGSAPDKPRANPLHQDRNATKPT